ncbi:MAG: SDR family oxidoreductase [Proteobacteria bacterium]|nr:SDR family oxidoreductase [Pseudomonadota bacterium]MBU1741336.1 SDR family oxidoreductase [Pseudomonadota bacterium]
MGRRRDFSDKVVFLTGAAGGMGTALARRFAAAGSKLVLTDRDAESLGALAERLQNEGADCLAVPLDVTDEAACAAAVARGVDHFGGLDVLVNNAGITHRSAFGRTDPTVFRRVMDVNLFGSLFCARAALPHLIESRGLIVVISSIAGFAPLLGRTGYAASKHALHGLFDSLRAEVRPAGVDVTIVCPGFTATGIDRHALGEDGRPTDHPQSTTGRVASPDDVAAAVLRAATRSRRLLVLSTVGRLTRLMNKICPGLYERLMARSLRSELAERD